MSYHSINKYLLNNYYVFFKALIYNQTDKVSAFLEFRSVSSRGEQDGEVGMFVLT